MTYFFASMFAFTPQMTLGASGTYSMSTYNYATWNDLDYDTVKASELLAPITTQTVIYICLYWFLFLLAVQGCCCCRKSTTIKNLVANQTENEDELVKFERIRTDTTRDHIEEVVRI
jgi:hypothetical protein